MARFGNDFDYKSAHRHAWLHCAVAVLTFSLLLLTVLVSLFVTLIDHLGAAILFNLFVHFSSIFYQNQSLSAPLLAYIYLMHSLQKRYALLNQMLRWWAARKIPLQSWDRFFMSVLNSGNIFLIEMVCIGHYVAANSVRLRQSNLLDSTTTIWQKSWIF